MKLTYSLFFGLIVSLFSLSLHSKEIAFTLDDSPRHAGGYFTGPERAKALLHELKTHHIEQVAFFSVSKHLNNEGKARLKQYSDAGHIIANHTHSHPDFNKLSLAEYIADFTRADKALSHYPTFKKWFRFPYLREGDTQEKRDGFRQHLAQQGYFNAYITANNYDWYIESLFQRSVANKEAIDFEQLKAFYLDVMIAGIDYYDELAVKHLGRSPKHVLLMHEMDITALFIGDLADELRKRGWTIIPPERAFQDDIAHFQYEKPARFNPGRIGEIARTKGQKKGLWHSTLEESWLEAQYLKRVIKPAK